MAKERPSDRRRKKLIKYSVSLLVLILVVLGGIFYPNFTQKQTVNEDMFFLTDKGNIPTGDFTGFGSYLNNEMKLQPLDFVSGTSSKLAPLSYKKLYDAPGTYFKPKDYNVVMGAKCSEGDLIRYMICDGVDKSTCKTDMFIELWQVQKPGNYLESTKFYIDDLEFRWSYTCYQALASYVPVEENSYLDGLKCVKKSSASSTAKNYETEKLCLDALSDKIAQQKAEEQLKQEIANERLTCVNNGGTYFESSRNCEYPKKDTSSGSGSTTTPNQPVCTQVITTAYDPDSMDCRTFSTPCNVPSGWKTISSCDELIQEDTSNQNTNDMSGSDTTTDTNTNTDTKTQENVVCKPYESLENGMFCKFSVNKLFSDQAFGAYYKENPATVVIAIIMIGLSVFMLARAIFVRK